MGMQHHGYTWHQGRKLGNSTDTGAMLPAANMNSAEEGGDTSAHDIMNEGLGLQEEKMTPTATQTTVTPPVVEEIYTPQLWMVEVLQ